MEETKGSECLRHSNWLICSLLSHFCSRNFPTFALSYWGANSYYPRGLIIRKGDSANFRNGWNKGIWVPWAFKLVHLQPLEPLLFQEFSNFCTFILGGQFLLPQRANNQERGFCQLQKWMKQRDLGALGIQIGSLAASWATFVPGIFQLFHFHTGEPILITPEG